MGRRLNSYTTFFQHESLLRFFDILKKLFLYHLIEFSSEVNMVEFWLEKMENQFEFSLDIPKLVEILLDSPNALQYYVSICNFLKVIFFFFFFFLLGPLFFFL